MAATVAAGSKLGRYEIVKHLTSGGMADLLLARAGGLEGFERHVVIKRIRVEQENDQSFIEMFLHEARLAGSLHHHNIVQVYDIGEENGKPYFAMEYVHGEDLRSVLRRLHERKEQLPIQHLVTIMSAVATALHHAHEQKGPDRKPLGIVHRDVTPANILVGYDGNVKVVDFGIARATARMTVTQTGMLAGKAPYMAPEQCTGGVIDRRCDVFAVGTVLFELATVRRLFKGDNEFVTMSSIVKGTVPKPSSFRKELPPELDEIILRALARDPAARYQNAEQLYNALDDFALKQSLRTSSTALAAYMKQLFGERPEPWVGEYRAPAAAVDFDGLGVGVVAAPSDADANSLPKTGNTTKNSPIARALETAGTALTPLVAAGSQGTAVPKTTEPGVAIPRTKTPVPAPLPRAKQKSIQIPVAKPVEVEDEDDLAQTAVVTNARDIANIVDGQQSTAVVENPLKVAAAVENAPNTAVLPIEKPAAKSTSSVVPATEGKKAVKEVQAEAKAKALPKTTLSGTGTAAPARPTPLPSVKAATPAPASAAAAAPARASTMTEDSFTDVQDLPSAGLDLPVEAASAKKGLPSWSKIGKADTATVPGRPLPKLDDKATATAEPANVPETKAPVKVEPTVAKAAKDEPAKPPVVEDAYDGDTVAEDSSGTDIDDDSAALALPTPPAAAAAPAARITDPTAIVKPLPSPTTTERKRATDAPPVLADGTKVSRPAPPARSNKKLLLIGGAAGAAVLAAVLAFVIGTSSDDATKTPASSDPPPTVSSNANNVAPPADEAPRQPRTWANSEKPAGMDPPPVVEDTKPTPTEVAPPTEEPKPPVEEPTPATAEPIEMAPTEAAKPTTEEPTPATEEPKVATEEPTPATDEAKDSKKATKAVATTKPVTKKVATKATAKKPVTKVAAKTAPKATTKKATTKKTTPKQTTPPPATPGWDPNSLFPKK